MRRTFAAVTAVVISLLSLTACSSSGSANAPDRTPPPPRNSDAATGGDAAPTVDAPLDASAFAPAPCESLTAVQTQELGFSPQGEEVASRGCNWTFGPNLEHAVQLFYATVEGGLQNDYNKNTTGAYDDGGYFEPTSVNGYPAVFSNIVDFRDDGTCDLNVGISDETIFHVTVMGQAGKDNCEAASTVASNVIETLKDGER